MDLSQDISLYVHIPFCETKCPYCDFNTYARLEGLMMPYASALAQEIALWGRLLGQPDVGTIFLGGGTPSYVPAGHVSSLLETVRSAFRVRDGPEITLEANPGDFDVEKLEQYLGSGVNRLSIGVQSLEDGLLRVLGRRHTAGQALDAFRLARKAGFDNVSLDLMFGLPYQDADDWKRTLEVAMSLQPDHLSLYCLTLENGTPLEAWVSDGQVPEPDPDLAADMYLLAEETLERAGFRHYEISNWARPGFESRHNLQYWRSLPYLGVGPGAHSYLERRRFFNIKSPREYIKRLSGTPKPPSTAAADSPSSLVQAVPVVEGAELIDRATEMGETLMMGFRLDEGVSLDGFYTRFGESLSSAYGGQLEELTSLGLVEQSDGAVRLTPRGRLLGNEVFQRFLVAPYP